MADSLVGALLQVETAESSGVFVTIPKLKDINGPNLSGDEYDDTDQDSGLFKKYVLGRIDPGELSGSMNYRPGNALHNQMASDKATNTVRNYRVVYPNGKYFQVRGTVKTFQPKAPVAGIVTADWSLRLTGQPTFPTAE